MDENYFKCAVEVSEDDLKDFLITIGGYDEDEVNKMNLDNEIVDIVNGILSDHFSDYLVTGKNTITLSW